jgi:hypothetical protein
MRNDFCIFILTHGRSDRLYTLHSLLSAGYTGKYYLVIDNEDKTSAEYYKLYGDRVKIFDKKAISKTFDTADNFDNRKTIVYARNYCFQLAKELGVKYFLELDDDYTGFCIRFNGKGEFKNKMIKDIDEVLENLIEFYESSGITCLAFAQGGDFIGGAEGFGEDIRIKRKAMNTLLCSVDREFKFLGRINEDVNTYVTLGQVGKLFITLNSICINQVQTQTNKGGMTDIYLESGTYLKSFYTVMYAPSCVKIGLMGNLNQRIHHNINWNNAVPKIVEEKYKKV